MSPETCFDAYASSYQQELDGALAVTGENREYYAQRRVRRLSECLLTRHLTANHILDYGCGDGATTAVLLQLPGASTITGVDASAEFIATASQKHGANNARFAPLNEFVPQAQFDVVYCNGVFHHIAPARRAAALQLIFDSLRPGGLFSLWENNPWNPGTRYVMSRCAFDRDAITISPRAGKSLLHDAGFEILQTDFLFFFPRLLAVLRPLERVLRTVPLGGQYQILSRKPRRATSATP